MEPEDNRLKPSKILKTIMIDTDTNYDSKNRERKVPAVYTAVIDGMQRSYVYESSMIRNVFISKQRAHYKNHCYERKIEYFTEMFMALINHYWKYKAKSMGKSIIEDNFEVNLFDYYFNVSRSDQSDIFRKNPYFHDVISKAPVNFEAVN